MQKTAKQPRLDGLHATTVFIGSNGVLNLDTGVNDVIGEGLLFADLEGTGTFTEVAPDTYDNSLDWIIGEGTVTVGASVFLRIKSLIISLASSSSISTNVLN